MQKQKLIGGIIVVVLVMTQSFTNWVFFGTTTAQASGPVEENKLVAIFVEQNIYEGIKTNLQRYTLQYIQSRFPRTKALVFPVDTKTIQATDIQKILSNLYHGGEKDVPSTLIGTVLIGNIPLPVIKKDDYIYPSVLPYTDIEKPSYVYDNESKYFIPQSTYTDSKQELFHGLITFENAEKYNNYFQKLKTYVSNPKNFVDKKFWFEDFEKAEETFTDQNVPLYLQGQIFDSDLAYHRYSPLLFSLMQKSNNDEGVGVLQNVTNTAVTSPVSNDYPDEFSAESKKYTDSLASWQNDLSNQATQGQAALQQIGGGEQIPTLVLGQSITQQTKTYNSLFSAEYGDYIAKEIETSGRWTGTDIGSHMTKAAVMDQQTSRSIVGLNAILEAKLDEKMKNESWAVDVPLPVLREEYTCLAGIPLQLKMKQENFYFGMNAWFISNAGQTTRYRGAFANYTGVNTALSNPWGGSILDTTDSSLRGIGASYGFTAQQVIASKGYNALKAKSDADAYEYWRKHCGTNNNANISFDTYVNQFRGGHTPANVDGNTMQLKSDNRQQAFNPRYNTGVGGALFDMGGARLATTQAVSGQTAAAVNTFGRFIQVAPGSTGPFAIFGSVEYPRCQPKNPIPSSQYDYFASVANGANKDIQVVASGARTYAATPTCKERLVYKTIDSVVKHTSPTKEEIEAMNITTRDRAIDVKRYVSFQGYAGEIVKLQYPDLYNVEVYKSTGVGGELKSVDEIKQAIVLYLQNKVQEYNTTLSGQNALASGHLAGRQVAYIKLGQVNSKASVIGRQYAPIPTDFFVQAIGDTAITQIAQNIHLKNSGWPTIMNATTISGAIATRSSMFSLAHKMYASIESNITHGKQGIGINTTGYEAAYIRTNGSNTILPQTTPAIIQQADAKIQGNKTATNKLTTNSQQLQASIDQACGVGSDGTVPLLKRPKALTCWWKNLRKTALKDAIKISYKNAQGPVLPLSQFGSDLKETYQDYNSYVTNSLDGDLVKDSTITSLSLQLPTQRVIHGAQLPLSVSAKNAKGDEISNLLFPVEISVETGELLTMGQASAMYETTVPQDPIAFDTRTISPSVSSVRITARGPIMPNTTGTAFNDMKEIILVDGALQTLVNGLAASELRFTLPNEGYMTTQAGIASVRDETLPSISLRLTDSTGQPITSPASIVSTKGIIQPGVVTTDKEQTAIGSVDRKRFTTQNLRTINGGVLTVKLLPSMAAGEDSLIISVPGLPDREFKIYIAPSSAFQVSVTDDIGSNGSRVRLAVQDKRGNLIASPTQINYSILGDATSNGIKQGVISSTGNATIPLSYGQDGGAVYIYGSLNAAIIDQQPGYLRKDIPTNLWPKWQLNTAYLTLDGKDRGDMNTHLIPDMISSSPKLIAVTTDIYDQQSQHPVVGIIQTDGTTFSSNTSNIISIATGDNKISVNNTIIGYVQGSTPYALANIIIQDDGYKVVPSWAAGSTDKKAFAIVQNSIQDEDKKMPDLSPIRSYAGGLTVGEAQKFIFDDARINYGDPFMQHVDAAKPLASAVDTTVTIFRDDTKIIKKVMELDIENDGRKDLVILYDDDTIRFMKQYGGSSGASPYRQLGGLMAIADGVQDIWIGDADNNGLQDIFIRTKKNTLRVYKNLSGSFDVNGSPICIDVPSGNTSLQDVRQLFIEDMNKDNASDIITYDVSGKIRIFYGGSRGADSYYVSNDPTGCDAGRKNRNSILTVATQGLQLQQNKAIYDDSLVHRQGLVMPTGDEDLGDANDTIPASIAANLPDPSNPSTINIQGLINAGIPDLVRYTAIPYDRLPSYESSLTLDNIAYIPLKYLTGNDTLDASKSFAYASGDIINVTVTLRARQNTIATYIEQLRGPWSIEKKDDGSIDGFDNGNLPSTSIIDRSTDNGFEFMIDNIALSAGQAVSFSYPVRYRPTQSTTIGIADTNSDGWLDITTTPNDSCIPTQVTYVSNQGSTYTNTTQTLIDTGAQQLQSTMNSQLSGVMNASAQVQNGTGGLGSIPGLDQAIEKRDIGDIVDPSTLTANANFDLNILNDPKLEKDIDDIVKGLCQGFGGGGGKLPVPFNMAFLAPGDINVFGCKKGTDKGLPVFFFPGTLQTPVGPIPIPYGLKGAGDGFYWAAGGAYPSMIRIYVAPTLTLSVGVAVCFGPYAAGIKLPNPIKHIAGNCIVIAKKAGSGNKRPNQTAGHPQTGVTNANTAGSVNGQRVCTNAAPSTARPTSPFVASVYNGSRDLPSNPATTTTTQPLGIQQGTYLGVINFDTQPYATKRVQDAASNVQLKGGKAIKLQIEGGNVKGLIKCVISKWLDNQIRYMINNLTNMSINIYLPDISQIAQGFKDVQLDNIGSTLDTFKKNGAPATPAGSILKNLVTKSADESSVIPSKDDVSDSSEILNNPFNTLASRFEQVPLIRVNTKNVTVQVPFIYSEEITSYGAKLEAYLKSSSKNLKERENIIRDLRGKCQKETNASRIEACNQQVANYVDISTKTQQLENSVRQNLQTLQAYKRFPLELQSWLTVSQRYITEVTDTVQGVSSDITSWLNTNATRFDKYVDTIILMISAVKSWQALIDFSTSRKSKCGQCTVDNYDYYSCTLGLLCPKLPILAIPPFKLPNIFVDLSHVRLGMDVVLPNVHFVPKSIPLPALPELPTPPTITADFTIGYTKTIPSIPQLPAPPRLPELPSFIPSIDINLPTLPPAPKVPRISPAISATLKITSTIGKILCIVKNGIGLVGEKGVKTRIEQLTQRTRSVQPFDALSITKVTPPLRGFDLRIDSYLNFEMNFDILYKVLDDLTKKINKKTNTIMSFANTKIDQASQAAGQASQLLQEGADKGNINIQGYVEPEMVDPDILRKDLHQEITALKNSEYGEQYAHHVAAVENTLGTDTKVKANTASVHKATQALQGMLQETSQELEKHKDAINSYDTFLDQVNSDLLISDDHIQGDISATLFTANPKTIETIKNAENPMVSYLHLQKKIAKGFSQALETHSPEELNMGIFTYNKLKKVFSDTEDKINTIQGYVANNDSIQAPQASIVENVVSTVQAVVAPSVQAASTPLPVSPSNAPNIRRDEHSVYTNQTTYAQKKNDGTEFTRYYDFEPITKQSDFASKVDEDGYLSRYNSAFNVWNAAAPMTSFTVDGQSNTNTNLRWKNTAHSAYIIMLTDAIYAEHDLNYSRAIDRKYVIAYASGADMNNTFITLPGESSKRVTDLVGSSILEAIPFEAVDDITITLRLTGNKWSYASIAPLITTSRGSTSSVDIGSAWSVQETLGVQRRGDTTPPVATARIRDRISGNTVAQGVTLRVPRNGKYDLIIQRTDDGVIRENTIRNIANLEKTYAGDNATIESVNTADNLTLLASAYDQSNNLGTQSIQVIFEDPSIEVKTVEQQGDERKIGSLISQVYPDGFVRFYNQRSATFSLLTGTEQGQVSSEFITNTTPSVTGGVFYDADTISLFTNAQERMARIEKKTGKIIVEPQWKDRIALRLDFTQNTPSILIIDTTLQQTVFSLYLRSSKVTSINATAPYTVETLTDTLGTFQGGSCFKDTNGVCVLYSTTEGNTYSPDLQKSRLGGTYTYEGGIRYNITIDGKPAGVILFTPMPLQ